MRNVRAQISEDLFDCLLITDVNRVVGKTPELALKLLSIPLGRAFGAEEVGAHIIVNADNLQTLFVKKSGGFAADKARRAGDNSDGLPSRPRLLMEFVKGRM